MPFWGVWPCLSGICLRSASIYFVKGCFLPFAGSRFWKGLGKVVVEMIDLASEQSRALLGLGVKRGALFVLRGVFELWCLRVRGPGRAT